MSQNISLISTSLAGIAQNRVLAGDVRKAAKIDSIDELRPTGRHALVATRPRDETVAFRDGAHRRFQQCQRGDAAREVMRQHFGDAPGICAAGLGDCTRREPASSERS